MVRNLTLVFRKFLHVKKFCRQSKQVATQIHQTLSFGFHKYFLQFRRAKIKFVCWPKLFWGTLWHQSIRWRIFRALVQLCLKRVALQPYQHLNFIIECFPSRNDCLPNWFCSAISSLWSCCFVQVKSKIFVLKLRDQTQSTICYYKFRKLYQRLKLSLRTVN